MRARIGRSERAARKRHRRVWVSQGKNGGTLYAGFRYFLAYPEAESPPLKLGRKHYHRYSRRQFAILTETVADSRKDRGEGR
mgnify:FL=1